MPLYFPPFAQPRWITPVMGGVAAAGSQTFTVGRVYLSQFVVNATCQVDGLVYTTGTTSAGFVTGGIVGPIARTADDPTAAVVVAQSASTAQAATTTAQVLTWTAVTLAPGIYYAALEGSDVTGTYQRYSSLNQAPGMTATYDRGGGYGTLTDPTPTATITGTAIPGLRIRVV